MLLHTGLVLGFKAHYFDSVIPAKHGVDPGGDSMIQTKSQVLVAEAQVSGNGNGSASGRKLATRGLNEEKTAAADKGPGGIAEQKTVLPQEETANDTKPKTVVLAPNVTSEQLVQNSTTTITV